MAPEPEVLKRKRTRPSDWWAASSSNPQQDREVRDAPATANRGRPTAQEGPSREDENMDDLAPAKTSHNDVGMVVKQKEKDQTGKKIEKLERRKRVQQEAATSSRSTPSVSHPTNPVKIHKATRKGRSSNDEAELRAMKEAWAKAQDVSKKSTRRSVNEIEEEPAVETSTGAEGKRGKRVVYHSHIDPIPPSAIEKDTSKKRQQRLAEKSRDENATKSSMTGGAQKKKRKRNSNIPESVFGVSYNVDEEERGRKRTRRSDVYETERAVATSTAGQEYSGRKSQMQADIVAEPQTVRHVQKEPVKVSKGGKLASKRSSQKSKIAGQTSRQNIDERPASGKGHSQLKQARSKRGRVQALAPDKRSVRRQRIENPTREQTPEEEPEVLYQHLAASTRNISRQTIEAKWDQLPSNCVELISQLLQDTQRPVVVRLADERKRTQASTALQMVSRRLISKITKGLPFPQGIRSHREDDFHFEKILDHNRLLEAQLTPALHANELLEAELSKEMTRLEVEQANLAELEANARTEEVLRNQAGRKLHSLLQSDDTSLDLEELRGDIGLDASAPPRLLNVNVYHEENLGALVKQVDGHVDSIQGNLKQVHGIAEAIAKSKAAVQATLFDNISSVNYEGIMLGMA